MTDQHTDDRAVEAVAKSICDADRTKRVVMKEPLWKGYEKYAHAAISAYRQHLEAEGMVVVPKAAVDMNAVYCHEIINERLQGR